MDLHTELLRIEAMKKVEKVNHKLAEICHNLDEFTPKIKEAIKENKDLSVEYVQRLQELNEGYSAQMAEASKIYANYTELFSK